jgi:hypothetical protein
VAHIHVIDLEPIETIGQRITPARARAFEMHELREMRGVRSRGFENRDQVSVAGDMYTGIDTHVPGKAHCGVESRLAVPFP